MKNLMSELKILPLVLSGSLALSSLCWWGYNQHNQNQDLMQTNQHLEQIIEKNLENEKRLEQYVVNLQDLNRDGIQVIGNKISIIEKRLPGMGGMLNPFKFFLDNTRKFNDAPEETNDAIKIVKEAQLAPGNLDRLQSKYMQETHRIQKYEFVYPFFKIPFEKDAIVYVSSDWGFRKNVKVDNKGNETYLGSSLHEGYDIVSTNKRVVAKYDYVVVLYDDFHNLPDGDRYKGLYGGLGRTAVLRRKVVHEGVSYGYYNELFGHLAEDRDIPYKKGDIIPKGATIGIIGNSGTASMGSHLHLGLYRVDKNGKNPIPVDRFINKTYGIEGMPENVLYFFDD